MTDQEKHEVIVRTTENVARYMVSKALAERTPGESVDAACSRFVDTWARIAGQAIRERCPECNVESLWVSS